MKDDVGDFEHRRVVLCVTKDSTTWFVLVNLTTVYPGKDYDDTCVLEPGVEKYITKRCYAYYALCEPISKEDVLEGSYIPDCHELSSPRPVILANFAGRIR